MNPPLMTTFHGIDRLASTIMDSLLRNCSGSELASFGALLASSLISYQINVGSRTKVSIGHCFILSYGTEIVP